MERFLGDIHPRTGLAAYSARVDSVLTYGAQIVVITADSTLRHLEKVQVAFLRRLLHVHKRSMTAILFLRNGLHTHTLSTIDPRLEIPPTSAIGTNDFETRPPRARCLYRTRDTP